MGVGALFRKKVTVAEKVERIRQYFESDRVEAVQRTTMSLARLHHARGQTDQALHLLQSDYAKFTEGFATADLPSAKRLLDEWGPGDSGDRNV